MAELVALHTPVDIILLNIRKVGGTFSCQLYINICLKIQGEKWKLKKTLNALGDAVPYNFMLSYPTSLAKNKDIINYACNTQKYFRCRLYEMIPSHLLKRFKLVCRGRPPIFKLFLYKMVHWHVSLPGWMALRKWIEFDHFHNN